MQTASLLEKLLFYHKNLCFVIFLERSNSKTKNTYEQLIEKFENLNTVNDEEEREEHINFYLLERNFQNVLINSFKQYFLEEFENVKKQLNADKTGENLTSSIFQSLLYT